MHHVFPDPQAANPDLGIPRSENISTLRVFVHDDSFGDGHRGWTLIQDYRDKSVLNGFASVGGLWTFLSGIFTIVFGTSLLRMLFGANMSLSSEQTVTHWLVLGVKPISLFGVVHSLQRKKMRDAFTRDYPQIYQDISGMETERGFLALVHDHVIDLGFLVEANRAPSVTKRQDEECAVFDESDSTYPLNPRTSTSGERSGGNVVDEGEASRHAIQR